MNILSKNLELRYISHNPNANGETDFKGETSTLSTEQRVDFLNKYADKLPEMFDDFSLSKPIVSMKEAKARLKKIKPQPQPSLRKRIKLDTWKWVGYNPNKEKQILCRTENVIKIEKQNWRCFIEFEFVCDINYTNSEFAFGSAAIMGFDDQGIPYYITANQKKIVPSLARISKIKFEIDFVNKKWNLYLNDALFADFVAFSNDTTEVSQFTCPMRLVSKIWGVGYRENKDNLFEPYSVKTFIDEDFKNKTDISGWNFADYDDSDWQDGTLPIVHGGERRKGEDLYLRREFTVDEIPRCAELYIESLTPGGEVYINGRLAAFINDEYCHKVNVLKYIKEGANVIAVRVYPDEVSEETKMTHTNMDLHTGWFAGRMYIDLLPIIYIDDVFSWTESIGSNCALQKIRVAVKTKRDIASKRAVIHTIKAELMPWYPESGSVCAKAEWTTETAPNEIEVTEGTIKIENPELWTSENPRLYKLVLKLTDGDGKVCDDYVITIGIRTVSQEGGIFRINGKPELLRAPLLFGARPPLDKIATWEKCPPEEYYIQEMLMVKRMNGNGFRMSVHDKRTGGINDPRICELADQLGIMLVWQTTTWLRITAATNIDYDELTACITQVRNHPSIVIWQPMNHPSWRDWSMVTKVYRKLYDCICKSDRSRLISPAADSRRMRARYDDGLTDFYGKQCDECDPIWTADLFCRGNMDYILGYGNEWSALREWPYVKEEHLPNWAESTGYIPSYLESKERAYFNFEHDEITGQPNWDLYKGKPMYHLKSYEWEYDEGSIGRELGFDEWLTSQAWQAFGAYEVIKKCRMLDYDGLCWCNLRGGQNSVTYQKSLIDYYGAAKLAYYTHRMVFSDVVACSGNVDVVYGPQDTIPVIVFNIGDEKTVNVHIEIENQEGNVVFTKVIQGITLKEGRTVTKADNIALPVLEEGIYSIGYTVYSE